MNSEMTYPYHKGKLYARYGIFVLAAFSILYGMLLLPAWNTIIVAIFLIILAGTILYIARVVKIIKSMDFFIKCDNKGVYTKDAFDFCPYSNIIDIELKRYVGYQTLYFEVKEANLKTKITPMKSNGKIYYCVPLADCKGDPNKVYMEVLDYFTTRRNLK